jgi:hypothetical protein
MKPYLQPQSEFRLDSLGCENTGFKQGQCYWLCGDFTCNYKMEMTDNRPSQAVKQEGGYRTKNTTVNPLFIHVSDRKKRRNSCFEPSEEDLDLAYRRNYPICDVCPFGCEGVGSPLFGTRG